MSTDDCEIAFEIPKRRRNDPEWLEMFWIPMLERCLIAARQQLTAIKHTKHHPSMDHQLTRREQKPGRAEPPPGQNPE